MKIPVGIVCFYLGIPLNSQLQSSVRRDPPFGSRAHCPVWSRKQLQINTGPSKEIAGFQEIGQKKVKNCVLRFFLKNNK